MYLQCNYSDATHYKIIHTYVIQARRKRGAGEALFGRSVNPISTRGVHYPHPVLHAHQIFRPCDDPVKQSI